MNENTIIVTRTLDVREMESLRRRLRELWPGQDWTVLHGQMLRDVEDLRAAVGPSEFKGATMTLVPRYE